MEKRSGMRSKIATTIVALIVMASITPSLVYSDEGAKKVVSGGGVMSGLKLIDLAKLSTKLEAKGFQALRNYNPSYGGGGYGIIKDKIILSGEGLFIFKQNVFSGTAQALVDVSYGVLNIGYVIISAENFIFFPMFGVGVNFIDLRIAERGVVPTFDEVLDNPKRQAKVSTRGVLFQFGIGWDYFLQLGGDKKGKGGLLFGIRLGYTHVANKADWRMGWGGDVLGGPSVGVTGPYVHFIFGTARFRR